MKRLIGLEAEFLYYENGAVTFPPALIPVDDFPLFGEVRGEPASSTPEVVANFWQAFHLIKERIRKYVDSKKPKAKDWDIKFVFRHALGRNLWKKALKAGKCKDTVHENLFNINGTDISDHSDLIIEDGKIKSVNISCGLHVHFSAHGGTGYKLAPHGKHSDRFPDRLYVQDREGRGPSVLTKPAIIAITKGMDMALFDRMAVPVGERTKYRKPGYLELKSYGFEYRSLPATDDTLAKLDVIVDKAFELLKEATEWN